jgi:hypothetical protein
MVSSKNDSIYAAVASDHPAEEDSWVAEAIGMQSTTVEVQAPSDLPEGYQLSVEMEGETIVVAVVCIICTTKHYDCVAASPYSARSRIPCDSLCYVARSLD